MANILSSIRSGIASIFNKSRTSLLRIFTTGTTEVYPDINSTTAITKGFNGNAAVYSIVKKDAKKFGSVPRFLEKKGQEGKAGEEDVIENDLSVLLNRPNEWEGQDAFFSKVRAYYKVCGEAMIWLNRGDTDEVNVDGTFNKLDDVAHSKKPVLEMYNLPPNKVIVNPDPENVFGVLSYTLDSNTRVPIRAVDVIHWKDINLEFDVMDRRHLRGMSPLTPGRKTITANDSASDTTVRMNQNNGAKGALINKTMAPMSPKQETALREVVDGKINSKEIINQVAALQGDYSYLDFGQTSVEMDVLKGKEYSMKELCFLWGMPYEFFDSQVTYANKEEAQKGWVINEIMPDCKQLDNEMNRVLPLAFGLENSVVIKSDFDDMPELQEDKGQQIEWLMKAPVSINEIREAIGYDESTEEGTDEIFIPTGFQPLKDLVADDGGEELLKMYANGNANRSNGVSKISGNGKGAKVPAGKGEA